MAKLRYVSAAYDMMTQNDSEPKYAVYGTRHHTYEAAHKRALKDGANMYTASRVEPLVIAYDAKYFREYRLMTLRELLELAS